MTVRAKTWTGFTIMLILIVNYLLIGAPLFKKEAAISARYSEILEKNSRSEDAMEDFADNYLMDVLKRERSSLSGRIKLLNSVTASLLVVVASWVIYGIVFKKDKRA